MDLDTAFTQISDSTIQALPAGINMPDPTAFSDKLRGSIENNLVTFKTNAMSINALLDQEIKEAADNDFKVEEAQDKAKLAKDILVNGLEGFINQVAWDLVRLSQSVNPNEIEYKDNLKSRTRPILEQLAK